MKKAQGLSFNMIVVAMIAIFVLLLIVVWATGAFSFLFGQTKTISEITEVDITAAQTKCTQYCIQAQGIDNPDDWKASNYCAHEFDEAKDQKDWNSDGDVSDKLKCYHPPISSLCSTNNGQLTKKEC